MTQAIRLGSLSDEVRTCGPPAWGLGFEPSEGFEFSQPGLNHTIAKMLLTMHQMALHIEALERGTAYQIGPPS